MNYPQGPYPPPPNQPRHSRPPAQNYPSPQRQGPPPPQRPPQQYGQQPQQYGQQPQQYGRPPVQRPPGPQYPQRQQQYGQTGEGIAVTTEFFVLQFILFLVKPKIFVDGQEVPVDGWGRTVLPARPGQHHVQAYTPFLPPKMGPAETTVNVHPGRLTELEYKAPLFIFSPGSLGEGPQKYNGLLPALLVAFAPFALLLLWFVFVFLLALI